MFKKKKKDQEPGVKVVYLVLCKCETPLASGNYQGCSLSTVSPSSRNAQCLVHSIIKTQRKQSMSIPEIMITSPHLLLTEHTTMQTPASLPLSLSVLYCSGALEDTFPSLCISNTHTPCKL